MSAITRNESFWNGAIVSIRNFSEMPELIFPHPLPTLLMRQVAP
jgi:hypothetical protein